MRQRPNNIIKPEKNLILSGLASFKILYILYILFENKKYTNPSIIKINPIARSINFSISC